MQPVNLFALTRISKASEFTVFEKHLSHRKYRLQEREREVESLNVLVDMLVSEGTDVFSLDGFYFGYVIPQLGKEFDLLKFTDSAIINIELKSEDVGEERRIRQLRNNRHYLKHIGLPVISFVFVSSTCELYEYEEDRLVQRDIKLLSDILKTYRVSSDVSVNELFKVSEFLVSPLSTPEKFIKEEYILTQQQEVFKENILKSITSEELPLFFYIEGRAGTGKTLLFYDTARSLSSAEKCCLIHCGKLVEGHEIIADSIENLSIISMNDIDENTNLDQFRYIFVDGAHRITAELLEKTVDYVRQNRKICFFSFDKKQVLSRNETRAEITDRIKAIDGIKGMCLKNKIRTNKMMQDFIRLLFCMKGRKQRISNVSILYANTDEEAVRLIELYRSMDYIFINYTASGSHPSRIDRFRPYEYCSTHDVIGQEFDNIIMYMDENFFYDSYGFLRAHSHPHENYIYTNLLFQGVTRVKEKLCLVVINNERLFNNLLETVASD
ncbi:MAG: hypothetical protein MJ095_09065 [Oscillospiraceae bacterium]|nr:hypothetical protein [Oscillospiraceae bacterium]